MRAVLVILIFLMSAFCMEVYCTETRILSVVDLGVTVEGMTGLFDDSRLPFHTRLPQGAVSVFVDRIGPPIAVTSERWLKISGGAKELKKAGFSFFAGYKYHVTFIELDEEGVPTKATSYSPHSKGSRVTVRSSYVTDGLVCCEEGGEHGVYICSDSFLMLLNEQVKQSLDALQRRLRAVGVLDAEAEDPCAGADCPPSDDRAGDCSKQPPVGGVKGGRQQDGNGSPDK